MPGRPRSSAKFYNHQKIMIIAFRLSAIGIMNHDGHDGWTQLGCEAAHMVTFETASRGTEQLLLI